jgi:hypothetical protein
MDPLAVLMSTVLTSRLAGRHVVRAAADVLGAARRIDGSTVKLPCFDEETSAFAQNWFADPQRFALTALETVIHGRRSRSADALRLTLSRFIITKDSGASLARDVSHSRPHRVADSNTFDVFTRFDLEATASSRSRRRNSG